MMDNREYRQSKNQANLISISNKLILAGGSELFQKGGAF